MKQYMELKETDYVSTVNELLSKGWELVETVKGYGADFGQKTSYVLGYPYESKVKDLTSIIEDYERHGFKSELFKKIAEENGDNYTDILDGKASSKAKTVEYITEYEQTLDRKYRYSETITDFDF
ncbi:hypothetical protein [Bacillus atrophaeus]|uniref:hypothetical protein n=1 Tax=Bacillus atrophaeus TaxID=1452 RepID=UPI00255C0002|nr:hypothetical protein [Bacillus atrophaeus]MDL5141142.1 hypothetical protein [Bacillus atrophaeus]